MSSLHQRTYRRRAFPRQPVTATARLFAPETNACVECAVKDISTGGALIALRSEVSLPDRVFLWHDETEATVECEVRWRRNDIVGLKFIDSDKRKVRTFVNCCLPLADKVIPFRPCPQD